MKENLIAYVKDLGKYVKNQKKTLEDENQDLENKRDDLKDQMENQSQLQETLLENIDSLAVVLYREVNGIRVDTIIYGDPHKKTEK